MMRFFLISVFILVLQACSLPTTKGYLESSVGKSEVENPYFSNEKTDYIYKAKIAIYNKKFGGLLIVKKTGIEKYRIVFTTEFGNKIFDFQMTKDDFKVNYILDDFNKKVVLKTLQNDFDILIKQFAPVERQFDSAKEIIYQTSYGVDYKLYYFFSKGDQKLFKIVKSKSKKEKVLFNFLNSRNAIGTKIDIIHQNFKLNIHLSYIGN